MFKSILTLSATALTLSGCTMYDYSPPPYQTNIYSAGVVQPESPHHHHRYRGRQIWSPPSQFQAGVTAPATSPFVAPAPPLNQFSAGTVQSTPVPAPPPSSFSSGTVTAPAMQPIQPQTAPASSPSSGLVMAPAPEKEKEKEKEKETAGSGFNAGVSQ